MKTLLWVGNPFFRRPLARMGWEVIAHIPEQDEILTWENCSRLCPHPDLVVVADMSRPPFVLGVENFPCPTILYAVDSHIHSWLPWYAQAFDACLISLRDHIPQFAGKRIPDDKLWWSPPFAPALPERVQPLPGMEHRNLDVVFIGRVNEHTPIREAFLEELAGLIPNLEARFGDFNAWFPRAKIVINSCEQGDLNFRVFESMGLGAALVTPAVGHGLRELFSPGRQLLTYPQKFGPDKEDCGRKAAQAAAPLILELLAHPQVLASMAQSGFEEVDARHRAFHRAQTFAQHCTLLLDNNVPALVQARQSQAPRIRELFLKLVYLHWAEQFQAPHIRAAYIKAAK